jgi:hypothetical protein
MKAIDKAARILSRISDLANKLNCATQKLEHIRAAIADNKVEITLVANIIISSGKQAREQLHHQPLIPVPDNNPVFTPRSNAACELHRKYQKEVLDLLVWEYENNIEHLKNEMQRESDAFKACSTEIEEAFSPKAHNYA